MSSRFPGSTGQRTESNFGISVFRRWAKTV